MNNRDLIKTLSPLALLQRNKVKSIFKKLCEDHHLVYFGHVNQREDEHEIVRGITFSAKHSDDHYLVGTVAGYDLIFLQRTDIVEFPGKPTENYSWTILQIDLHKHLNFAQTLVDCHNHGSAFYENLFAKFNRLVSADHAFDERYSRELFNKLKIYTPPDEADILPLFITPDILATIAHHFAKFDIEWHEDHLIIYSNDAAPSRRTLDMMLREGLWLAAELEKNAELAHKNFQVI